MHSSRPARYAEIEASALSETVWLPSVCSRHGEPAHEQVEFGIVSKPQHPPGPALLRLPWAGVLSMLHDLLWVLQHTKVTKVNNWPVCRRCKSRRRIASTITRILFWLGLVGFVSSLAGGLGWRAATGDYAPGWLLVPLLGGFAAMLLAAVPLTWARYDKIARATTSPDGTMVSFSRPHRQFCDQMRAQFGGKWRTATSRGEAVQ